MPCHDEASEAHTNQDGQTTVTTVVYADGTEIARWPRPMTIQVVHTVQYAESSAPGPRLALAPREHRAFEAWHAGHPDVTLAEAFAAGMRTERELW